MTEEDKQLIAAYMGWKPYKMNYYFRPGGDLLEKHDFDLNDAGLGVAEMQKRGEYNDFYWRTVQDNDCADFSAWLFNAENFFAAMSQWLREGK